MPVPDGLEPITKRKIRQDSQVFPDPSPLRGEGGFEIGSIHFVRDF
jgi:hypothetical protein